MSAATLVVLSSPPRPPPRSPARVLVPSSPDMPSPTQLFGPAATNAGAATPRRKLPSFSPSSGFETASALLRREVAAAKVLTFHRGAKAAEAAERARELVRGKADDGPRGEAGREKSCLLVRPAQRRSHQKARLDDGKESRRPPVEITGASKCRERQEDALPAQTKIVGGKITKSAVGSDDRKRDRKVSTHLDSTPKGHSNAPVILLDSPAEGQDALGLEKALARRRNWTPTKAAHQKSSAVDPAQSPERQSEACSASSPARAEVGRGALIGQYGYSPSLTLPGSAPPNTSASGHATLKKRKIELLDPIHAVPTKTSKAVKPKAVKKKPPTITDQATGPYQAMQAREESSLRDYFPSQERNGEAEGLAMRPPVAAPSPKRGKKATGKKQAEKTASTKAVVFQKPRIPEEAVKAMQEQNFAFGTSSQLAQGLTGSQRTVDEAQTHPRRSSLDAIAEDNEFKPGAGLGQLQLHSTKTLWSAASRNADGSLHKEDPLDLPLDDSLERSFLDKTLIDPRKITPDLLHEAGFVELDEIEGMEGAVARSTPSPDNAAPGPSSKKQTAPKAVQKSTTEATLRARSKRDLAARSEDLDGVKKRRTSSKKAQDLCGDRAETMPDFNSYAKADLKYALDSLGFKPISKREVMVEILEKCWKSKRRLVLESVDPNKQWKAPPEGKTSITKEVTVIKTPFTKAAAAKAPPTAPEALEDVEPPRKKRGRPRKNPEARSDGTPKPAKKAAKPSKAESPKKATRQKTDDAAEFMPIEEITATASTTAPIASVAPTPALTDGSSPTDTPVINVASRSAPDADLAPVSTDADAHLLAQISAAIAAEPPTHDAARPSWHEKMLLYDPVVLEDLALWLNVTGLGRVGCDAEVGPGLVRDWCGRHTVCCVWRLTGRKKERSRL